MPLTIRRLFAAVFSAAVLTLAAAPAAAQPACTPDWLPLLGTGPGDPNAFCSLTADIDGPGGDGKVLIVGGRAAVLAYHNHTWDVLGSGFSGDIYALAMYDHDGDGPQPASLIAGGNFSLNSSPCGVARYDRASNTWTAMASGITYPYGVKALAVFDPDASGPLPPMLYAGGDFASINGAATPYLVKFDGTSWTSGGAFNNVVRTLCTFDPDGDGPLPARLYASGTFSSVGVPAARIASFDGAAWGAVGAGVSGTIYQLTVADTDGPGPNPARLIATGSFSINGNASLGNLAAWTGAAWSGIGPSLNGAVETAGLYDPDGAGPLPPRLVVAGWFYNPAFPYQPRMYEWTGAAWNAIDNSATLPTVIAGFDVDAVGRDSLVVAGGFQSFGGVNAYHAAAWDGTAWKGLNGGVDEFPNCIQSFDPDGPGGAPPRLIVGGNFSVIGGRSIRGIAQWDGAGWSALGTGFAPATGMPTAMCVYDDDGPGPHPAQLIVAGSFTAIGGIAANRIAAWNGTAWSPLGAGFYETSINVTALTAFDPDGYGPALPLLIAGGSFAHAGSVAAAGIAAWNGSTWSALPGTLATPSALISFDPDGPGGAPPQLIAAWGGNGGGATLPSGARGVARWNGADWQPMGAGFPSAWSLKAFDADGPGPQPPRLVAAVNASPDPGLLTPAVAQWDGTAWTVLGGGGAGGQTFGRFGPVMTFDADGDGPATPLLIVCPDNVGYSPSSINAWDGAAWRTMAAPFYRSQVLAGGAFDPDGDGPQPPVLVLGGSIFQTGRYAVTNLASFGCTDPVGTVHPCGPADVGATGGELGSDGQLDNNDFVVFIDYFFNLDPRADIGSQGGAPGADDQWDNNDFIIYIDQFFAGCD